MGVTVIFGFIIVGIVPFFEDFLSLVGASVNPIFTNVFPGLMILFFLAKKPIKATELVPDESTSTRNWLLNTFKAYRYGWKEAIALVFACFMILTGCFIIVGGTYSTILNILTLYKEGAVSGVFSCADNSE